MASTEHPVGEIAALPPPGEKPGDPSDSHNLEYAPKSSESNNNEVDEVVEEEPELHARTYVAVAALFFLNFVQVFVLTGPPTILPYIGAALNGTVQQNWVPNALSLMQAVIGPLVSFGSDTFQARKLLLIVPCTLSLIGSAIAPNMNDIYGLIGATILIGFGFAAVPLTYTIPSEIIPRRWRPMVQSGINIAASMASISSPLIAGAFIKKDPQDGWQNFYWVMMALWGVTVVTIFFGYKPPKRHTRLDSLTIWQKIGRLDLPGGALLTAGLTLLLAGLSLGANPWPWSNVRVLTCLVIGCVTLVIFGVYEWKFTKQGIFHHDLFRGEAGRTLAICIPLIFVEGIMLFTIIVFYPALTAALFEDDPILLATRTISYNFCSAASTVVYGLWSSKTRDIRTPMAVGYALFTAGLIGMCTLQPGQSTRAIVFNGLAGLGFGAPLILIIAAVQLGTPHHLIATATAVATSSRAVAATTFTAIYGAALNEKLNAKLPSYIASAAIAAGLPESSVPAFVGAIAGKDAAALPTIPGVTPEIIGAGAAAAMQALADSFRVIYIIAVPFGAAAVLGCYFIGDLSKHMHYKVDAPVEVIHAKHKLATSGNA